VVTLAEALADVAAELPGVTRRERSGATQYELRDGAFAVLEAGGEAASFLLAQAVADAAVHTPDTVTSTRGPGWVTLQPTVMDDHAIDRAVAWLQSAWRNAGG
jgi:hypothetical protein